MYVHENFFASALCILSLAGRCLSQVEKVGFLYQTLPNGEIEIDDVEFSQ